MKTILITGASGFIGRAVAKNLFADNKTILFDRKLSPDNTNGHILINGDITDESLIKSVCSNYTPDVIIHCAGIAHQQINKSLSMDLYDQVNNVAANNIAKEAAKYNPNVHFIFLSSTSVYGENYKDKEAMEKDPCYPTSDYARSKFDAECELKTYFNRNLIKKLDILRLAPVYDVRWNRNLEKRVLGPHRLFYIRFGSGHQKMSVLARQNLVDFIAYRIEHNSMQRFCNVFNVTDEIPVSFNNAIKILQRFEQRSARKVIKVPLLWVWIATRVAGFLIKNKVKLVYSFYDKLANDLIFDNERMLKTGFNPKHSLKSVFVK